MDVDAVAAEVAVAVGLAEGPAGVADVLRVIARHEPVAARGLAGQRILRLGDDDLVSVALAVSAGHAGPGARPRAVTVLDCDPDLVGYLRGDLGARGLDAEVIEHDLHDPLPAALTGAFDVACTDRPYTVAGAELFLSRAVAALAPGAGGH